MIKLLHTVGNKVYQLCREYPGGTRAMFMGMKKEYGLAESSVYADINQNSNQAKLRVWELVRVMEATGNVTPLREIANWFGYYLTSVTSDEAPDAPTFESEALQDYPALVRYHEGGKLYREGKIDLMQLDALKDAVIHEIRQTFTRTVKGDEQP